MRQGLPPWTWICADELHLTVGVIPRLFRLRAGAVRYNVDAPASWLPFWGSWLWSDSDTD